MADTRITPKADPTKAGEPSLSPNPPKEGANPPKGEVSARSLLEASKDEALNEAKQMVREAADEQRRRAAGAIGGMAGALHKAASDMTSENEMIGRYTNIAAERLDQVADYLRSSNWEDVLSGAEDMARRQPYWFVGGAMAAGFVLARVVKSSGMAQRQVGQAKRFAGRLSSAAAGTEIGAEPSLYPAAAPSSSAGAAGTVSPGTTSVRSEA